MSADEAAVENVVGATASDRSPSRRRHGGLERARLRRRPSEGEEGEEPERGRADEPAATSEADAEPAEEARAAAPASPSHAPGELDVPDGIARARGRAARRRGARRHRRQPRSTATSRPGCSSRALAELERAGVADERSPSMPVPGAFELPLGGDGAREDAPLLLRRRARLRHPRRDAALRVVAGEAASGLQLAALETGVPVAFGVLTCDTRRAGGWPALDKGAEAVRTALEMADLFAHAARQAKRPGASVRLHFRRRCPRSARSAGRSPAFGNNRSHSMVATKRRFDPNLQRVRVLLDGKATARVRLHPLPQGRQGPEGRLGRPAPLQPPRRFRGPIEPWRQSTRSRPRSASITISSDAIAHIVGETALECYGVVGMAAKGPVRRLLGRERLTQGIQIGRNGDGGVTHRPPRRRRVRAQPRRGGVDDPQPRRLRGRPADGTAGARGRGAHRGRPEERVTAATDLDAVQRVVGAALASLEASRHRIDDLNVYPVPDGDTGTNLTMTVRAVADAVDESSASDRRSLARDVARGALMGARGNSGVIFSQIVRGAADVLAETTNGVDPEIAARALRGATDAAYRAVRRPVEGTMLSVIRELAEEAESRTNGGTKLGDLLIELVRRGEEAVARTPEQLAVLREAGVVDAGGAGLLELVRGVASAVSGEPVPAAPPAEEHLSVEAIHQELSRYRYCTVFLIEGEDLDRERLEDQLEELGDSLLVVGDEHALKVHVHTDDPGRRALARHRGRDDRPDRDREHARADAPARGAAARVRAGSRPGASRRHRHRRRRRGRREPAAVREPRRERPDPDRRGRADDEPVDGRPARCAAHARHRRGDPPPEQLERPPCRGAGGAPLRPAGRGGAVATRFRPGSPRWSPSTEPWAPATTRPRCARPSRRSRPAR